MDSIDQQIQYFVPKVNAEFGLGDKNDQSIDYFRKIKDVAEFVTGNGWYVVYCIAPDMWGNKELYVISLYVEPDQRPYRLLKIMHLIFEKAKTNACHKVMMGCHLGNKQRFHAFLQKNGWTASIFEKEI